MKVNKPQLDDGNLVNDPQMGFSRGSLLTSNTMVNITEKKKQVRELVIQSSLVELMDMREKLLHSVDTLPDEIDEEDVGLLDAIQTIVESSENDVEMQETIQTFLRLDEIGRRRSVDPEAPIDDLLVPIVVNPTPVL